MAWNEVESGSWKPDEVGAKLEGTLKSRKTLPGRNGEDYTVFTIEEATTKEEVNIYGAVLESKLAVVDDGAKILLTYKGKPKGTYRDFSVAVWED